MSEMSVSTAGSATTYVREDPKVPFILRVLWFFLIGWHVTLWWVLAAWFLVITIIGMPLGLWMLNRTPVVLTLRMPRGYTVMQMQDGQAVARAYQSTPQRSFVMRALYFVLIGWWLSLGWSLAAWALCVTIIGLPIGVAMLNRLPNVTTLMRQ
jgi:uncharacterized membrane protein YccF (DUF307 family)